MYIPGLRKCTKKTGKIVVFYKAQGSLSKEFPQLKEDDFVLVIMNNTQSEMLKQFGEKYVAMNTRICLCWMI